MMMSDSHFTRSSSDSYPSPSNQPQSWVNRAHRHFGQLTFPRPRQNWKAVLVVLASLVFGVAILYAKVFLNSLGLFPFGCAGNNHLRCQALEFSDLNWRPTTTYHAFDPIAVDNSSISTYRRPDTTDTFVSYKYRQHPECNISSLSLHNPFAPLCRDRQSFLAAFSGGGRIGFDAPYMPLGCDMRWYATEEVCNILSRFEKIIVVGDSMMRHVVGAMNVVLRRDLGYGAVTGWNFGDEENEKCFCTHQMDVKACSVQGVYRTSDVLTHDPNSFACPQKTRTDPATGQKETTSTVNLIIELMLKYPLDPTEVTRFRDLLPKNRPDKPIAFIFGHGLWNDLDLQATVNWLNGVMESIYDKAPYLQPANLPREMPASTGSDLKASTEESGFPLTHILFITPSAAGPLKPDQWITSQGDKALQIFEKSMHSLIHEQDGMFSGKGIEHMGTWNMSTQMEKWDGVHLDLRGNLLKAMGVMNWLDGIQVEQW